MATIRERTTKNGKRYHVQVRLRGYPTVTASFPRLTDARNWAASQESAIREGRTVTTAEARRRTLGEAIDRYLDSVLPSLQAKDEKDRRRHLAWWKERLGLYVLARVTPALIAEGREALAKGEGPSGRPVSAGTQNRYLQSLSPAFSVMVREWEWRPFRAKPSSTPPTWPAWRTSASTTCGTRRRPTWR